MNNLVLHNIVVYKCCHISKRKVKDLLLILNPCTMVGIMNSCPKSKKDTVELEIDDLMLNRPLS